MRAGAVRLRRQRDVVRGRCAGPAPAGVEDRLGEVHLLALSFPLAGPAEHQQVVDRVRHAIELLDPRVEVPARGDGVVRRARLLEPQPQAGERGAQLMRRIGDELGLGLQRTRQPVGHEVERAGERALLPASLARVPAHRDRRRRCDPPPRPAARSVG